jgi:hypothetical protein
MAEVLRTFDTPIQSSDGIYRARVIGRHAADGMWDGWLEFVPETGPQESVVTHVESRQPEREHLVYWASGLSTIYAEGALARALRPLTVRTRIIETPVSQAPARNPVLNPFDIGARNLDILEQELGALDRSRLLDIVANWRLNSGGLDLTELSDPQLVQLIVAAVESRLLVRKLR